MKVWARSLRWAHEVYIVALEPKNTAAQIWRHVRPSDADGNRMRPYSTPILLNIMAGQNFYRNWRRLYYRPQLKGMRDELWRWGPWNPGLTLPIGVWFNPRCR